MNLTAKIQKPRGISGTITGNQRMTGTMQAGGRGVVSDYNELTNKPSIESVELVGDKTFEELGMVEASAQEILDIFLEV